MTWLELTLQRSYANASVLPNLISIWSQTENRTSRRTEKESSAPRKARIHGDQVARGAGCPVNEQSTTSGVKQGAGSEEEYILSYPCTARTESDVGHDIIDLAVERNVSPCWAGAVESC